MKELTIGDISIASEDNDTWEDLIKVVEKLNKAYLKSFQKKEMSIIKKLITKIFRNVK
jgi:hypothetical protein